jgi:4-amino-4-deoxy-L-arabinose transferase-like glycosyltransferase
MYHDAVMPQRHPFIITGRISQAHRLALMICAWFVLLALVYAAVTPPLEAPDEGSHFLYIHNLLQTGALPVLEDRETVFASGSTQRHHPPLYYLLGAALVAGTQRADADLYLQRNPQAAIGFVADNNHNIHLHPQPAPTGDTGLAVSLLRLYSIALGAGTVWCIYRAGHLATGDPRAGLLAALLTASIPSFIHISASISNDNLVTLLFAAGVCLCLRIWQRGIARLDAIALSLIVGMIALTKTNGLALLAVILGTLALGALRRRFSGRAALAAAGGILAGVTLLAGWWYARNVMLYGDPLALDATLHIWSRGEARLISLFEAQGVWDSFWFTLAHLSLRGPSWLFDLYLPLTMTLAAAGVVLAGVTRPALRLRLAFLGLVAVLVVLALLAASSRINVSQGRILFPGLVAFAPLVIVGWIRLAGYRGGVALALPLALLAILTPAQTIAPAFPRAQMVDAPPATATRIDAHSDGLTLLAYEVHTNPVHPGDLLRLTVYFSGAHPARPLLFVKALDPVTQTVIGGVDTYPAMLPTDSLAADQVYAAPLTFRLGDHGGLVQLDLALGWHAPDTEDGFLPLADASGTALDTLLVAGPTLLSQQPVNPPTYPAEVVYGHAIELVGTSLDLAHAQPGGALHIDLNWRALTPIAEDWTLSIGLLDADGQLAAQADGMPDGYPTSAWVADVVFTDQRTVLLPDDLPPGDYRLYTTWYRLDDGQRLPPEGDQVQGDIYLHPRIIRIQ